LRCDWRLSGEHAAGARGGKSCGVKIVCASAGPSRITLGILAARRRPRAASAALDTRRVSGYDSAAVKLLLDQGMPADAALSTRRKLFPADTLKKWIVAISIA
jgi:hypothetical protein